jgi:hypothetical protein
MTTKCWWTIVNTQAPENVAVRWWLHRGIGDVGSDRVWWRRIEENPPLYFLLIRHSIWGLHTSPLYGRLLDPPVRSHPS